MSKQASPWFDALDEHVDLIRWLDTDMATDLIARLLDEGGDNPLRALMPHENGELSERWWDVVTSLDLLTDDEKAQLVEDNRGAPLRPDGKYLKATVEVGLIDTVIRRYLRLAANNTRDMLRAIESTWWVSSEIIEGITEAAETHPRSPLQQTDMPCMSGFARFGSPLVTMDVEGYPVATIAIAWRARSDAFTTTVDRKLYGFPSTAPGVEYLEFTNAASIEAVARVSDNPETRRSFQSGARKARAAYGGGLIPIYEGTWIFGAPWDESTEEPVRDLAVTDGVNPDIASNKATVLTRQWLATFWHFVQEDVIPWERPSVPRHVGRRVGRALIHIPEVRVVDLRRLRPPSTPDSIVDGAPNGSSIHWHHSWVVRGHWRVLNRGTDKERAVWVSGYVKGPANDARPLVVKPTVYRVRR